MTSNNLVFNLTLESTAPVDEPTSDPITIVGVLILLCIQIKHIQTNVAGFILLIWKEVSNVKILGPIKAKAIIFSFPELA